MTGASTRLQRPQAIKGTTAPYGNIDKVFDICKLTEAAGASYIARGTVYHAQLLAKLIKNGILNKGFSVIDAVSVCPTYYGRKNKKGDAIKLMEWLKDHAVNVTAAAKLPKEKLEGKFLIGELYNNPQPEYTEEYKKIIESIKRG